MKLQELYMKFKQFILTDTKRYLEETGKGCVKMQLEEIGKLAKAVVLELLTLSSEQKNQVLKRVAERLVEQESFLIEQNRLDVKKAEENGISESMIDRLRLTKERISGMAEGLVKLTALEDPIGEVLGMAKRPNGLLIGRKRVPLGVIGIIYESRPNVTADAFGLCFKTGNAVILRGGSDAIHSNIAILQCIQEGLRACGISVEAVQLITDTDREIVGKMMKLSQYIDVLIPRGGAGLIKRVVENSTIPVIETGTGNCHIYVDEFADIAMAEKILINAKTQRTGVCNACESLVIHEKVLKEALPVLVSALKAHGVEIRADEKAREICADLLPASEEDFGTEYLDLIISVKTVASIEEAIAHINRYNTGHSEAIITKDYGNAQKFLQDIDAAAVYVNASTRFTDGFEFGFGAEIGISTQKLHARGPMGLEALTTYKYIVYGDGQIRP